MATLNLQIGSSSRYSLESSFGIHGSSTPVALYSICPNLIKAFFAPIVIGFFILRAGIVLLFFLSVLIWQSSHRGIMALISLRKRERDIYSSFASCSLVC